MDWRVNEGLRATLQQTRGDVAEADRAMALDPSGFLPHYGRAAVVAMVGDAERTISLARDVMEMFGRHPLVLAWLPRAYMRRGDVASAEAMYAELQWRSRTDDVSRMALAVAADAVGRVGNAIAYAIESMHRGDFILFCWLRSPRTSEALRTHERYPEVLREGGL